MNNIQKTFALFTAREKRRFCLVLSMVAVMALLETATVASIMPFLAVLGDKGIIETNVWLNKVYHAAGFSSHESFLLFLGGIVLSFLVLGNAFKVLTTWAKFRFVHMRGYSLSRKMLRNYMDRKYSFFLGRNSADLTKNVLSEVDHVITGIMIPGMEMVCSLIVVFFLSALLFLVDPMLVLIVVSVLSLAYLGIYKLIRHKLNVKGKHRVMANIERYTIAGEIFGGIKDVKLMGLENEFASRFRLPAENYAMKQSYQDVASRLPKFIMEGVAFGGIVIIALYLLTRVDGMDGVIPVLGMFAFAGYKILPALQQIFAALTKFRFSVPALDIVTHELEESDQDKDLSVTKAVPNRVFPVFSESIRMDGVYFRYPGSEHYVVRNLNLEISAGSIAGLVGTTGSGKTTVVDIILGLLEPVKGRILVDRVPIDAHNVRSWQHKLGYVPQNIYISDDTVAANIAYGVRGQDIDIKKVQCVAELAMIDDFIEHEMPDKYLTVVGERGIRLSGGQRQRLGIARALYRDPEILVLDEATSALDNITEKAVMQAIEDLGKRKTIIVIAHRLSTVEHCDLIYLLDKGKVKTAGTYEELLSADLEFQSMVHAGFSSNGGRDFAMEGARPI